SRIRPEEALRLDSPLGPNRLARAGAAPAPRAVVHPLGGGGARSRRIASPEGRSASSCRSAQPGPDTAIDVALTVVARLGLDLAYATAQVRRAVFAAGAPGVGAPVRARDNWG